jgi:hypothetical protein
MEDFMRAFILSLVVVAVLAIGFSFSLNAFQQTAAQNNAVASTTRLGHQADVNLIGRQG